MIESTALDFWRKSKKPEIESYIIDHDFRKIQVKNTASYWILPYIYIDPYHIQINAYEALHRVHMALTEYHVRGFLSYS